MRKIITARFWVENEDLEKLTDNYVEADFKMKLSGKQCFLNYELLNLEQMEIVNEKANVENSTCDHV